MQLGDAPGEAEAQAGGERPPRRVRGAPPGELTLTRTPSDQAPARMESGAVLAPERERTSSTIARSATRSSAASASTVSAAGSSSTVDLGRAQLREQVFQVDGLAPDLAPAERRGASGASSRAEARAGASRTYCSVNHGGASVRLRISPSRSRSVSIEPTRCSRPRSEAVPARASSSARSAAFTVLSVAASSRATDRARGISARCSIASGPGRAVSGP